MANSFVPSGFVSVAGNDSKFQGQVERYGESRGVEGTSEVDDGALENVAVFPSLRRSNDRESMRWGKRACRRPCIERYLWALRKDICT